MSGPTTAEQLVGRLVDAATALLAEKGPSAVKAREVAEAAQVSTTAVYYHLGGLPELIQAVVDRGFHDLGRAFSELPASDDPVSDLFSMALTSVAFARRNPHLYDLMFGLSTRGSYRQPSTPGREPARRTEAFRTAYAHLVDACRRAVRAGRTRPDEDSGSMADQLWSCVHGYITLELGGYLNHSADPVDTVLQRMTVNLLVGLGDAREPARASHVSARVDHDGSAESRVSPSPTQNATPPGP